MRKQALATCLLGLPLALPGAESVAVAAPQASQQAVQDQKELDEVTVEGRRERQRKPQQSFDWLARLVGEFTIDGHVQPNPDRTSGDHRDAQGHALCIGFGIAPGVLCDLRVRWPDVTNEDGGQIPGGISTLDPAVMLFGFNLGAHADAMYGGRQNAAADPDSYTIAHILVDNTGVAEGGSGFRAGTDTMTSRAPCVAAPKNCERMVRISAPADLKEIAMRIDLEIEGEVAMRYDFVMHRMEDSESVVFGRKPAKERKSDRRKNK